jgi:aspartate aminotransferase
MRTDSRLAERLNKIKPSSTLAITSQAKKLKSEGKDVISFAAGEPDFDTPDFIKAAAAEAMRSGFTKYTPSTGIPELKQAIVEKFKQDNALEYTPNQIVVSCGAKHSIFNVVLALIGPGDEVLIPHPYWVSYPEMVYLAGGEVSFLRTEAENSFKITPQQLARHIRPQSKLLILNSPSNPSGCVYTRQELEEIAAVCVKNNLLVISDEIYEKLIYDNLRHVSIASLGKEIYHQTITINGLSKSYSMTGWRIGYLGGPADIVEAISRLQDHSTSNPTSIAQKAALAALKAPDDFIRTIKEEFQRRRDYLIKRLSAIKKMGFVRPQGAFYAFCGIKNTGLDSTVLSSRLLAEALVAVIPGAGFGRDDYVRLSFAASLEQLQKGMDRIEDWLKRI